MSDARKKLASLSPEQRVRLLEELKKKKSQTIARDSARPPVLPLSHAEERLHLVQAFEPNSPLYNLPLAAEMIGALDPARLEQSMNVLIQRHESLRTSFPVVNERPIRRIAEHQRWVLPLLDLRHLSAEAKAAAIEEKRVQLADGSFDLEQAPLFRALLIACEDQRHVFLITLHHIIFDGWSSAVLFGELVAMLQAVSAGLPEPPFPKMLQPADFAIWERAQPPERFAPGLAYWKARLGGALPVLALPFDRPRGPRRSSRGGHQSSVIPEAVIERLKAVGREEQATSFMTLLAALSVLLHRLSGEKDILVGSPMAGRNQDELQNSVGFFVNTVVLRSDLSRDVSFRDLLRETKKTVLEAQANQDVPFDQVAHAIGIDRDPSVTPIFQVMFILQNKVMKSVDSSGLRIRPFDSFTGTARFDLSFEMIEEEGVGLRIITEYKRELFDDDTVSRITEHYRTLLESAAREPEQPISRLSILSPEQRRRILVDWNHTDAPLPSEATVPALFAAAARRAPQAPAVVGFPDVLSYAALDAASNRLAHHLRSNGAAPGTLIGVCFERSFEMVIGLLAIAKAGAAYVPLDPSLPPQRLKAIADDARPLLILAHQRTLPRIAGLETNLLCLDRDPDRTRIAAESAEPPAISIAPADPAYVIYTSGTTGRPKGVPISQSSLINFLSWKQRAYPLSEDDRVLGSTSIAFDPSVYEVFGTLTSGARLVLADPEMPLDPQRLLERIEREGVTTMQMVPSLLTVLFDLGLERCHTLHRVYSGGEPLPSELVDRFYSAFESQLINVYGPTEATIEATAFEVPPDQQGDRRAIPIGRPISNTRIYLLDERGEPVPPGVPGEITIAGAGLSRGYLNNRELSAEKFVPIPGEERAYRTGDLARFRSDGNIEFIGRIDRQVKVRGHRIELTEIEGTLLRHPDVCRVAVMLARSSDKELACYVEPKAGKKLEIDLLRAFLSRRLPEVMTPRWWMILPQLPLTPGGKVDVPSLPPIDARSAERRAIAGPRNHQEEDLLAIWQELLGTRSIGVTDDFFDVGGHSLLAMRLAARIKKDFGRELPFESLFRSATIERLAEMLARREVSTSGVLVEMKPEGTRAPLFLVHDVGGLLIGYTELTRAIDADQPLFGLQSIGLVPGHAPDTAIEDMAKRYVEAIRARAPRGPYRLGGWSLGGVIAFEMARRLEAAGEVVEMLALIDSYLLEPGQTPEDVGGTSPEGQAFDPAVLDANVGAASSYRAQPYGGRITLLRAELALAPAAERSNEQWRALARGGLELVTVPGHHYSLLARENARSVARALETAIASAQRGESRG